MAKKLLPHIASLILFVLITLAYFMPLLEGKVINQGDVTQYKGMSKAIEDHRKDIGDEPLWTNAMFGGMPAYQISIRTPSNLINYGRRFLLALFPRPANIVIFSMISFYILMLVLGVNPWVGAIGAIAYSLSTYTITFVEAGHITKIMSISTLPLALAGVLMAYRKRLLLGVALAGLGFAWNIVSNHYQITYYMLLMLGILFIVELVNAFKSKTIPRFVKASALLGIVFILGILSDATRFWTTYEYSKETIRGKSELTGEGKSGSGLDKDYALAWSYGFLESFSILVPNIVGGSSAQPIGKDSQTVKALRKLGVSNRNLTQISEAAPTYWGSAPFTGGPVYFGAIVCWLFLLGCFLVRGPTKWWLVIITIFSIMLAWGKNFTPLTDLFFYYFPYYSKFRVVSMILVIAQFAVPVLGFLALQHLLDAKLAKQDLMRKFVFPTAGLLAFLALLAILGPGIFDFDFFRDANYKQMGFDIDALQADRAALLTSDAFRSLGLIAISTALTYAFLIGKIGKTVLLPALALLIIGDIWLVDKRYLNSKDFVKEKKYKDSLQPSPADNLILQDNDPNFRVFNTAANTFNDAVTSYHHKSIGGYHGAKLRRYQDVIERYLANTDRNILNMLNAKYVITGGGEGKAPQVTQNPEAMGNAWFVSEVKWVKNANEELDAMDGFNPKQTAVIDKRFEAPLSDFTAAPRFGSLRAFNGLQSQSFNLRIAFKSRGLGRFFRNLLQPRQRLECLH